MPARLQAKVALVAGGQSLSSGALAQVYGFTDVDGTQPDAWRYIVEVREAGRQADDTGYR